MEDVRLNVCMCVLITAILSSLEIRSSFILLADVVDVAVAVKNHNTQPPLLLLSGAARSGEAIIN